MKIIITNFNEEDKVKTEEATGVERNNKAPTPSPASIPPSTQNQEFRGIDARFDDWKVNPKDGAVTNVNNPATSLFNNPNTQFRLSKQEDEEAVFVEVKDIANPNKKETRVRRRDVNPDLMYQEAMSLGRTTARAKALYDFGYLTGKDASSLIQKKANDKFMGTSLDYLIPTVAHPNIHGKTYDPNRTPHVPGELYYVKAKRDGSKAPSWNGGDRFTVQLPKTKEQIKPFKPPVNPFLFPPVDDYGQVFALGKYKSFQNIDVGHLAAPEEIGHAQVGLGAYPPELPSELGFKNPYSWNLFNWAYDNLGVNIVNPKFNNYFTQNNIPTYAQSMAEGAVGINAFRSDAGKYNTQLNYPGDYRSYWRFHNVYAPRTQFDQTLQTVGPMRTNNWQKQMLQLRYIADKEFERRFGRMPKEDEELPLDILDGALQEWDKRGLLRTAQKIRLPKNRAVV